MKKLLTLVGVSLLSSYAMAADLRVGVVDYMVINSETSFFRDAAAKMQESSTKDAASLQSWAKQLSEKQTKLNDTKTKLTDDQKKALQAEIASMTKKMEEERNKLQSKTMESRKAMMENTLKQLSNIVKEAADKEHCTLVFRKESIAYAPDMVDLTNQVVEKLKKDHPNTPAQNPSMIPGQNKHLKRPMSQ